MGSRLGHVPPDISDFSEYFSSVSTLVYAYRNSVADSHQVAVSNVPLPYVWGERDLSRRRTFPFKLRTYFLLLRSPNFDLTIVQRGSQALASWIKCQIVDEMIDRQRH